MDFSGNASLALLILTSGYALMILWFTRPLFSGKSPPVLFGELPFVSVIVAARNEEQNIRTCLEGLLAQDYPAERFEVIVSDDHSTDLTKAAAMEVASRNPGIRLTFLEASAGDGSGKKPALLRAVKIARGEAILTTDADTMHSPGWLGSMAEAFRAPGTRMALGPVCLQGESLFQKLQSLEFMGVMGLTAGSAFLGTPLMCNGANFMYEKKSFEETGGLSGNLHYPSGDDQFLLAAFRKRYGGRSVTFALRGEAVVMTRAEPSLAGFIHQRMRWVSKSKGYRDPAVIMAGALTYLLHAAILAGMLAGLFSRPMLIAAFVCWAGKMIAEFPMVAQMAFFFGRGKDLWLYIPAQMFQLVYVPVAGLSGLILPYRWKGRVIRA
jgi:cellulose synthase/poly-beta-1,6-N-acetylglucosamine synthase-like glycosyltransferase